MKKSYDGAFALILVFLIVGGCGIECEPAFSQGTNNQPKQETVKTKRVDFLDNFVDVKSANIAVALSELHDKTGVTIVMDDAPIKSAADFAFHGTLKDALNRLTDTFDYRWFPSVRYPKTIVLQKRFQFLAEHPQFHHHEMLQIARNVCRCLENPLYVPGQNGRIRPLLQMLYHKLDAGQLAALYQGRTLSYKELTSSQTLLLNQAMYCTALSRLTEGWNELKERLERLGHSSLALEAQNQSSILVLTFPMKDGKKEKVNLRIFPLEEEPKYDSPTESGDGKTAFSQNTESKDNAEKPYRLRRNSILTSTTSPHKNYSRESAMHERENCA